MLRRCLSIVAILVCVSLPGVAQVSSTSRDAKATKPATTVNLNSATAAELQALPGIGAKVAARIIDYRKEKGAFKKLEELMNVQGIGEKSFLKLRGQLTLGSPKPETANQH
jgi:competence protein ComEA